MTWSYASSTSGGDKDRVRLYIGDTDSSDPQLTDEELTVALAEAGGVRSAAALACTWLAGEYARKADKSVGDLSISYSQRFEHYTVLADRYKSLEGESALPYAGGVSIADKTSRQEDTDSVKPGFFRGLMDNRSAQSPSPGLLSEDDA